MMVMLSVMLLVMVMAMVTVTVMMTVEVMIHMLVKVEVSIKDIIAMEMMMHEDEMPYRLLLPPLHVLRLLFFDYRIMHDLAHTCNTLMRPTQLRPPRLGKEPCNANAEISWQLIRSDRCLPLKEPPHTQFTPLDMIWIPRRPPSKHIPPHAALTQRPAARQRVELIHKVPAPAPVAIPRTTRNTLRPHG